MNDAQPLTASPRRGCWSPAPPASPARSPRSSSGATRGWSWSTVTSRSDAGTRLDELYPRYRVPLELTELDLERDRRASTRRSSPTRTAPRRRSWRSTARARPEVVDLSADFRLRDLATYERWYGEHGEPELLDGAVYGLTELYREAIARRGAGRQPRLLPDRERCSRWRRSPSRACSPTSSSTPSRASPAPAAAAATRCTTSRWPRTPSPTRPRGTATRPRSSRS